MKAYINSTNSKKLYPAPALFLDRDGVINYNHGYVYKEKNFDFMPGIFELLSLANKIGYLILIVTNQAGIGRGLYTEKQFDELTLWMVNKFNEKNIVIDGVFYSPFHPVYGKGKYLLKEETRKPGSGMFKEALNEFNIDIDNSLMVGDNFSDIEASINAGIKNNFLLRGQNKDIKDIKDIKVIDSLSKVIIKPI